MVDEQRAPTYGAAGQRRVSEFTICPVCERELPRPLLIVEPPLDQLTNDLFQEAAWLALQDEYTYSRENVGRIVTLLRTAGERLRDVREAPAYTTGDQRYAELKRRIDATMGPFDGAPYMRSQGRDGKLACVFCSKAAIHDADCPALMLRDWREPPDSIDPDDNERASRGRSWNRV